MWPEIVAALIGGGVLAKIIDVATGRRKARADVADTFTDAAEVNVRTATGLMAELKEQVVELRNQNQALVLEVGNLRNENQALVLEVGNLRKENAELRDLVQALRLEVLDLKASHGLQADDGR